MTRLGSCYRLPGPKLHVTRIDARPLRLPELRQPSTALFTALGYGAAVVTLGIVVWLMAALG